MNRAKLMRKFVWETARLISSSLRLVDEQEKLSFTVHSPWSAQESAWFRRPIARTES